MCAALPHPEYYGGSVPPAPFSWHRAYPPPPFRVKGMSGTGAGGSRVHCRPVSGLGTRLYPCGIATANPQHFTVASHPRPPTPGQKFPAPP